MSFMKIFLILLFFFSLPPLALAGEPSSGRLIVVVTQGCPYCQQFKETIGRFYHKTAIGRRFPLVEVDQFNPPAEFEDLAWEIKFLPTFIVYNRNGKEIARFRGYRGEEPFWVDLEKAIGP
ncbi:MAG: transcriptional regulator [Magnetococcales bacterium]|nr:transcriptional regulator [Magnetococcales bacterium]